MYRYLFESFFPLALHKYIQRSALSIKHTNFSVQRCAYAAHFPEPNTIQSSTTTLDQTKIIQYLYWLKFNSQTRKCSFCAVSYANMLPLLALPFRWMARSCVHSFTRLFFHLLYHWFSRHYFRFFIYSHLVFSFLLFIVKFHPVHKLSIRLLFAFCCCRCWCYCFLSSLLYTSLMQAYRLLDVKKLLFTGHYISNMSILLFIHPKIKKETNSTKSCVHHTRD